jgi:tyrosyl-tRNA synthetase
MDTGISYAEFGYMLIQGYDFLHLFESEKCAIQTGGSDQWGNMTTGIELIRRKHSKEAHAFSAPLLTDSAGNKLGKSEGGAIYLDAEMTSPYQFHQYWLNQPDADVGKILRALTLLDMDSILALEALTQSEPEARMAQKTLAEELTSLVHGKEAAIAAEAAAKVMFSKDPTSLDKIDARTLKLLAREVPTSRFARDEQIGILDLLVRSGLAASKGEARRSLQGNAVSLNRVKVSDEKLMLSSADFGERPFLLLGVGKAKLHLVLLA